jgi:hypothetical protein
MSSKRFSVSWPALRWDFDCRLEADARRVLMSKIYRPPHVVSRRARVIVDAEGKKLLSVCVRCHPEKYILEDHTT